SAAARGVEVRIIIDSLGEKYSFPVARHYLKKSKVKIGRFLPLRRGGYVNLRNHRKILIVDGVVAFTGGMNIGDRHLVERTSGPPPVRDLHFRLQGPVVAELQKVFLEDWFFVTSELLDNGHFFPRLSHVGTTLARVIADGPDKPFRNLEWIIMGALSSARERIDIMTPYFIPDRAMISAITTAALRGVAVRIVLPARNNLPLVHWATRAYLWEFLQHGVQIYYQPPPFVHSKLFLVDNHWSLIGSANLDPRSLRLNFEVNLEIYDRDFCSRLGSRFASTIAHSRPVAMEEMDSRPLTEKLRDAAAKLFSPYL
ncbi:MAG TPA: phospholipase D-like domain-containing protein, partial [Geobacterales bacterium]|nr:phospholipase D-like domain-containing protein [Geobacterales bacterium]